MATAHKVQVKRVYDDAKSSDGQRILVDRVWPRGLGKDRAELDEWCKQVAPSTELRRWYGHDPDRFDEFTEKYHAELRDDEERSEAFESLRERARSGTLTLLTASKASDISQAAVLRDLLSEKS